MSFLEPAASEADFLHDVVDRCWGNSGPDGMWQVAPVCSSIPYSATAVRRLNEIDDEIAKALPELHRYGQNRANKAYRSRKHTITKPSYVARIHNFANDWKRCQVDAIEDIYRREPSSGGLVFTVFHPDDLIKRPRPGYVPCLVSGSFLVHRGELQLNAFFRSQSVVEFGLHDLLFLRGLQQRVLARFSLSKRKRPLKMGPLNISLARAIIQRRMARHRVKQPDGQVVHVELDRHAVVSTWLEIVGRYRARPSEIVAAHRPSARETEVYRALADRAAAPRIARGRAKRTTA